ncbi:MULTISPECIES: response regulator [Clostridium]|uniref:Stage 0 sporulation protein A homolog n=1 Tax=Clostridium ljungdahlii (strain ATCC 55383 / DSM 13528 / PETC) TaxID=748727 RepID=D8GP52_CLOLD|nr:MULTISPECIES: response regulator [Clostridium]ADK15930.1 putative response regulator receiver protein [Clostridium ljungdahlii DSM 13528]ALU35276.1 Response regulator receiver protein [Clostridium autoethanogenum DSM 10061]OAA87192.1 Transcriptional regulatory protein DegU [Clostridium ljungdahlii DSM 13528]OVY49645.1 Transcriptional regulatory protein DegU [Clostridium autoethanogenum]
MNKIKVLIADDIEETRNVIKKILKLDKENIEVVGEADNGEEVFKIIPKVKPDVVLMDINMPVLNGLEATEKITTEYPSVMVIIMSVQAESEYLKKAMFHGAKEYIIKPFNYNTLIETITTTYEKCRERQVKLTGSAEKVKDAKTIAFFSSKGGVGKSVLAVNTAIVLSKESDKKVLLMDMDLQFGDISMLVNKYNEKTILDAVEDGQIDSYENIKPYLYKYNNNLDIFFAPQKPEAAEYITKETIEKIMKDVRKEYDVIVVDTGINFNDSTLYILDMAQKILMVSTMEIMALKNTKLGLKVMESVGYDKDKVKLVINRFNVKYGINKKEVEEAFKDGVFAFIPDEEKTVIVSVNKGIPLCHDDKYYKLKVGKALDEMCKSLIKAF